jgi:hypothetical protein
MTDAPEDRSNPQTLESYGGLLEGIGPAASELSLVALGSTVMSSALRAVAGFSQLLAHTISVPKW